MRRFVFFIVIGCVPTVVHADTFDRYTNPILAKAVESNDVKPIDRLTPALVAEHNQLFPETGAVLLIVRTNSGNNAKVLVQFARQKGEKNQVPMALLERVTCYKAGQERALQAFAPLVHLYDGFQFNLDLGQVVPADLVGDLRYAETAEGSYLEPVQRAKLFLVTKHLPGTEAKKSTGHTGLGDSFDPQAVNGSYQLIDDGRRKALIELQVDAEANINGTYTSEQSGRAYEIHGKITPTMKHQFTFTVKFPNSSQEFTGYLFTKDAAAICGWSKFQGQEFGFYALREK
jgi:hypothetical protein